VWKSYDDSPTSYAGINRIRFNGFSRIGPPIDNLRPLSHPKRIHLVYGNSVFVASTEECQQSMDNVSEREVLIGAVKID
jgi:hypothetical protein